MTKKGKRAALLQRNEQITDLQRENEQLKARLAECEKRDGAPGPSRELPAADAGSAVDAFIICDSQLGVTDIDESALRYIGPNLRKEDVVGKDLADLVTDRERYERYLKVVETGERFTVEESLVLPDIGEVHVITRAFRAGDGLGILTSDVTAQKRMEKELLASEERSRLMLDNASEGVAVLQDGVMKYINPGLAAMSGFSIEEGIGKPFLDFVHPDDRQMAVDNYVRRQRGEAVPSRYEFRFLHKDGSTGWAQISVALHEWDGRTATLCLMTDITQRKLAEEALRVSEERNRLLIDNAAEVVTVIQDGLIKFINRMVTELAGYSPEELVSRPFLELIHPDDRQTVADNYARRLSGGEVPTSYQFRVVHKNGEARWAAASVTLFTWEGEPATLGMLTDITERKRAEELLRASEEKYRTLADQSIQGIMIAQGTPPRVVYCNAAMAEHCRPHQRGDAVAIAPADGRPRAS